MIIASDSMDVLGNEEDQRTENNQFIPYVLSIRPLSSSNCLLSIIFWKKYVSSTLEMGINPLK